MCSTACSNCLCFPTSMFNKKLASTCPQTSLHPYYVSLPSFYLACCLKCVPTAILFFELQKHLLSFWGLNGELIMSDEKVLFVSQAISIVCQILQRAVVRITLLPILESYSFYTERWDFYITRHWSARVVADAVHVTDCDITYDCGHETSVLPACSSTSECKNGSDCQFW